MLQGYLYKRGFFSVLQDHKILIDKTIVPTVLSSDSMSNSHAYKTWTISCIFDHILVFSNREY